jgi:hypothetical protein
MSRYLINQLSSHINKDGYGLEIGPLDNPIAPKKKGYQVQIIDCMSREELIKKLLGSSCKF